jgi:hypothetical protein
MRNYNSLVKVGANWTFGSRLGRWGRATMWTKSVYDSLCFNWGNVTKVEVVDGRVVSIVTFKHISSDSLVR